MTKNKEKTPKKITPTSNRKLLLIGVLLFLLLTGVVFGYPKYKDRENAKFIKGLSKDFPVLVTDIEQATGLELEQKVDCSITTEKFNEGVQTCELIVTTNTLDSIKVNEIKATLEDSKFEVGEEYQNGKGFDYIYTNKDSCGLGIYARGGDIVSFSCITAVREANVELARELFLNK